MRDCIFLYICYWINILEWEKTQGYSYYIIYRACKLNKKGGKINWRREEKFRTEDEKIIMLIILMGAKKRRFEYAR